MAMVAGVRSTLNPNAPVFIPAAFRQVEDFSPEWWELVKTSTWFRDYWLSEHEDESFAANDSEEAEDVDLLPESIEFGGEEGILDVEAQFEELVLESEAREKGESGHDGSSGEEKRLNGVEMDAKAVIRKLSVAELSPTESRRRSPVGSPKNYFEKPAKNVSPKSATPRRIQQPR